MSDPTPTPETTHGMVPGSRKRPGVADCICGAPWSYWASVCSQQLPPQQLPRSPEAGLSEEETAFLADTRRQAEYEADRFPNDDWPPIVLALLALLDKTAARTPTPDRGRGA